MIVQGRDYEHTLEFDRVAAPGLSYQIGDASRIARHVLSGGAFDAAEFSLSAVMILAAKGALPVVPIPVFPARAYIHSYLFVRRDSPLRTLRSCRAAGSRCAISAPQVPSGFPACSPIAASAGATSPG